MLTSKQQATLACIKEFIREQGRHPTLEEIGGCLGVSARSTVHQHVRALIGKGYLAEGQGKMAYRLVEEDFASPTSLPYHGKIAAGAPIEAIPGQDQIDLATTFCGPERYILRIDGDSMIEAGILDNDYVVIQKAETANNGDIVVALINGWEATLKYYFAHTTGVVELRPANSALPPMFYPADQVRIQGIMVGLFRDQV